MLLFNKNFNIVKTLNPRGWWRPDFIYLPIISCTGDTFDLMALREKLKCEISEWVGEEGGRVVEGGGF